MTYSSPRFKFAVPPEYAKRAIEVEHSNQYRSDFMRDRDRVLYSSAFRRMAGKTQVYLAGRNDHQRTRLTHTLEVSQIARTISQALGLNCDLTEAIALGHDLGHTPFGHAGEQMLHEIMTPGSTVKIRNSPMNGPDLDKSGLNFGFKHNIQSVRIAASLEKSYGGGGINLTNYTLWGILHHTTEEYKAGKVNTDFLDPTYRHQYENCLLLPERTEMEAWSFEAFVVREADEIAQWHHDLEDALRGNAMTGAEVYDAIKTNLNPIMSDEDGERFHKLKDQKYFSSKYITEISRLVVNTLVNQIVESSMYNLKLLWDELEKSKTHRLEFFATHSWEEPDIYNAIGFQKKDEKNKQVEMCERQYPSVIREKLHHSQDVERMNAKGQYIIRKLFQAYYSHPQQLPDSIIVQYMVDIGMYPEIEEAYAMSIGGVRTDFDAVLNGSAFTPENKIALMRKITDHIAGMTDHYAIEEFGNLYN